MSQTTTGSGNAGAGATDFHLPDEILSVIPTDPFDQLDLARKITSMAIASRVSKLESDAGKMMQKLGEKDRLIQEFQDKALRLEKENQEAEKKLKIVLDDNMKLSQEKDALAMTIKKLSRDLVKLETFKKQLMRSLNEDDSCTAETVDIGTCDPQVPKAYPNNEDGPNVYVSQQSHKLSPDLGNTNDEATGHTAPRFSMSPYITPRLTPNATPKVISTGGSPRRYSAAGSPRQTSGATSPTRALFEGRGSMSSWLPSSQQSSTVNSPPRSRPASARPPRIDGKEFFRQARTRLSYEQFRAFLANVKELNAQKQTREETLRKAEEIFGMDNKDLYISFQALLSRSVH